MFFRFILLFCVSTSTSLAYDVPYHWKYLNFTWPSEDAYNCAVQCGNYILENNAITGIKIWKDRIYLTVPRIKQGIPATLVSIPVQSANNEVSPLLEPFPNWDMQKEDDCSAFQFVMSMEIDPHGKMWIIDTGRMHFMGDDPKARCPAKLVVIDLQTNAKILEYVFPEDVVHRNTGFLNDIILDHVDGGWAYITDVDSDFPGIVVFSLKNRKSWKVYHRESMLNQADALNLTVAGTSIKVKCPINGIALSPASVSADKRRVYYNPLASFSLYSVPTSVLQDKKASKNVGKYVVNEGTKQSQSSGMLMAANGVLYFSQLNMHAMFSWNTTNPPFTTNHKKFIQDHDDLQWPDSIAGDENNNMWFVTNRLQIFTASKYDVSQVNFRLIRANIGCKNYQYLECNDGSNENNDKDESNSSA